MGLVMRLDMDLGYLTRRLEKQDRFYSRHSARIEVQYALVAF